MPPAPFVAKGGERGLRFARDLWGYASGVGETPWQALHDPHRAFNFTIYRTAMAERRMRFDLTTQATSGGGMGAFFARVVEAFRHLVEVQ